MTNTLLYSFYDWLLANEQALPKGRGLFSPIHIALIIFMCVCIVAFYYIFKKYKSFALKLTTILCYIMFISRLFRMGLLWLTGTNNFLQILPWHLCHVMAFAFPAFYLTKTKRFFPALVSVTFYGGLLTFIFGDYYAFEIFTFLDIESILLHFMMIAVSVACVATGYIKINIKNSWQVLVALGLLVANASVGNYLNRGENYLFLKENGLPFNFFSGHSHIYTYFILVITLFLITYLPLIIMYLKTKFIKTRMYDNYTSSNKLKNHTPEKKQSNLSLDDDMIEPALIKQQYK